MQKMQAELVAVHKASVLASGSTELSTKCTTRW